MSGIETGKENFTISVLESIANALGFPIRTIVSFVCYEINENWDIDFTLIMFAKLNGHQTAEPDWEYVKSTVNVETGSQRTETYITNLFGKTKLRDGSVYLDTKKISYRRWRQARRNNEAVPPWSIFF